MAANPINWIIQTPSPLPLASPTQTFFRNLIPSQNPLISQFPCIPHKQTELNTKTPKKTQKNRASSNILVPPSDGGDFPTNRADRRNGASLRSTLTYFLLWILSDLGDEFRDRSSDKVFWSPNVASRACNFNSRLR